MNLAVIPAQAGIQGISAVSLVTLDPRLRGDDGDLEALAPTRLPFFLRSCDRERAC